VESRIQEGVNINNIDVKKLLFSVGSPAIHTNKCLEFDDIIPYKLCSYNRRQCISITSSEQKDIDTTRLVDYVLDSLRAVNKSLSPEKIDDLCTVIGETLINAEEHSTTKCRFSIGYFHKINSAETQCGVLRLAIFNFGKSIYEKFKDPDCQNKYIVNKMKELSDKYTKRNLFQIRTFEEETLWTLYALQEGVTSVAPEEYRKRGNGSIQFIESFFNMKTPGKDKISRMTILSGNASITFDGTYKIVEKKVNDDQYKFMTFNKSGNIEDSPDNNFVRFVDDYFPGTLISVEILFNGENMYHE
jgi:hypothetical protein